MDELLQPRRTHSESETDHDNSETGGKFQHVLAVVTNGLHLMKEHAVRRFYKLDNAISGHKHFHPVPFLVIAGVLATGLILGTMYTQAYAVTVDGSDWGIVSDTQVFDNVVADVERQVSDILGEEYQVPDDVSYSPVMVKRDTLTSSSLLEARLYSQVSAVTQTYVLTVNGDVIGIGDETDLQSLLDQVAAMYITDTTTEFSFLDDIEISYQTISADTESNLDNMLAVLTGYTEGEMTYTAVDGDTYSEIAQANGLSLSELYALNPDINQDILHTGDVLVVASAVPYLSVQTVDTITYTEDIAYSTEQVEDSSMYQGETKVLTEGVNGVAEVTANVTSLNGYEQSREITSTVTVTEPVTQVVAVGTKEKPTTAATGTFRWPTSGTISSKFGTRWGRAHTGIDIAAPYGTSIVASDGGTVTYAGYKGSYGNLVIIDHGNGYQTYYGHCSSILVSVGTKVAKGQTIAKVGATGNATGNHCHFEIRVNGTAVNPLNYLP